MGVSTETLATELKIALVNYQGKLKAFNERALEAAPTKTPEMAHTKARLEAVSKKGGEKEQNETAKANFRESVKDKLSKLMKMDVMQNFAIDMLLDQAAIGRSYLATALERELTPSEIAEWKVLQEKSNALRNEEARLRSQVIEDGRALQRTIEEGKKNRRLR